MCVDRLEGFMGCLAGLELACEGGADFNVYANGDGTQDPGFFPYLGDYRFNIRDTMCEESARGYENCKSCGAAFGFDVPGGGIGDPCDGDGECVSGLQCIDGGCTRACTSDAECLPKHGMGECTTENGRITGCDGGMCTTFCRGIGYEVDPCPPE